MPNDIVVRVAYSTEQMAGLNIVYKSTRAILNLSYD